MSQSQGTTAKIGRAVDFNRGNGAASRMQEMDVVMTLVTGVAVLAFSGLGFLWWNDPAGYRRVANKVLTALFLAWVGMLLYDQGFNHGVMQQYLRDSDTAEKYTQQTYVTVRDAIDTVSKDSELSPAQLGKLYKAAPTAAPKITNIKFGSGVPDWLVVLFLILAAQQVILIYIEPMLSRNAKLEANSNGNEQRNDEGR